MAYLAKLKSGSWQIKHKYKNANGQWRVKKYGLGKITKAQALICKLRFETEQNYLKIDLPLPSLQIKFKELAEEYLEFIPNIKKPSTVSTEKGALNVLTRAFGQRMINQIGVDEIQKFLHQKNYRAYSALNVIKSLTNCYKKAIEWKYISKNPFEKLIKPKIEALAPKHVSTDTIRRILEHLSPQAKDYFTLLAHTGMRPGEGKALRAKDVTAEGINIMAGKTNRFRTIPVHGELKAILARLTKGRAPSDYLFAHPDGSPIGSFKKSLQTAIRRSGVTEHVTPNIFRHTFGTHVLKMTRDLRTVQTLLGHSKSSMTERYAHALTDSLENAVNLLDYSKGSPRP